LAAVAPRISSISALVAGTTIEFIRGSVASLDADQRRIRVATAGCEREIAFDQAIYALGSNVDEDEVPGAAAYAYRLEAGDDPRSAAALRSRLGGTLVDRYASSLSAAPKPRSKSRAKSRRPVRTQR